MKYPAEAPMATGHASEQLRHGKWIGHIGRNMLAALTYWAAPLSLSRHADDVGAEFRQVRGEDLSDTPTATDHDMWPAGEAFAPCSAARVPKRERVEPLGGAYAATID
jgi:hypothetical protein